LLAKLLNHSITIVAISDERTLSETFGSVMKILSTDS